LRLCIFSAEEWALAGSKVYLDRMSQTERARMQMNINLDTVAGDDHLTALTSIEFQKTYCIYAI
jgi:Zn-dependent M28 family amino/carboxypeptidase